ncbi:deaminase [Arthrobacter sp. CAU 1506]|uniref:dihydrofolate reductase family protein n=1 Tax=Arthrobacter sp. CAU 1506 TaxID=2560052 RepID=UPI0010AC8119|nr:dihydrofolate reductase family protein [Arthrobacter sp. CAU 1506]TJY72288.1 deaminase [Arthrobacter sp. CAU 1506]
MGKVIIHATVTLDGFMADSTGGVDWMFDFEAADEDREVLNTIWDEIGAVVGGANKTQTIEEGEMPYGGMLKVPVYLMTHSAHEPVEKDGTTYTFVVDDIREAVEAAKQAAGDKSVSLLGGSISRQCLALGLVDEIQLHMLPLLLGEGISLFGGLGERIALERVETAAYASETHLRFRVVR